MSSASEPTAGSSSTEAIVPLVTIRVEAWVECTRDSMGQSIDYSFWIFAAKKSKSAGGGAANVGVKSEVKRSFFCKVGG